MLTPLIQFALVRDFSVQMHAKRVEQFGKESTISKSKFVSFASGEEERDALNNVTSRFKTGWKVNMTNNGLDLQNGLKTAPGLLSLSGKWVVERTMHSSTVLSLCRMLFLMDNYYTHFAQYCWQTCLDPFNTELRMSSILTPCLVSRASANLVIVLDKSPRPSSFVYQSALDVDIRPNLLKCATSAVQVCFTSSYNKTNLVSNSMLLYYH